MRSPGASEISAPAAGAPSASAPGTGGSPSGESRAGAPTRRSRSARLTLDATEGAASQFDLWPQRVQVEALDVQALVGKQTRVVALYRVRYEREPGVHQVFLDHHGWYCADHGPSCKAVRDVTAQHEGS